jgi:predicted ArsR family transcriptional regulator
MTKNSRVDDPIEAIAQLEEPNRRRLFDLATTSREPIGRDDAAASLGISRELAAFHLDRLVEAGLLEAEYRRRGSRTGPGAGRPAKFYRRSDRELTVSLPPRSYDVAADVMATALDRLETPSGAEAVRIVARERGAEVGEEIRRSAGARPGRRRLQTALLDTLRRSGYEPEVDHASGAVHLRNCPFHTLATSHRDLTCGMNVAWANGLTDALLDSGLRPELASAPGCCCVVFQPAPLRHGPEPPITPLAGRPRRSSEDA